MSGAKHCIYALGTTGAGKGEGREGFPVEPRGAKNPRGNRIKSCSGGTQRIAAQEGPNRRILGRNGVFNTYDVEIKLRRFTAS